MSEFSKLRRDFKKQILKSGAGKIELKVKSGTDSKDVTVYTMKKIFEEEIWGFKLSTAWQVTNYLELYPKPGRPLDKMMKSLTAIEGHSQLPFFDMTYTYSRRQAAKSIAEKAAKAKINGTFISLSC